MRYFISFVAVLSTMTGLVAQTFDLTQDKFDFLPSTKIQIHFKGSIDTLDPHSITLNDLYSRTNISIPTDSSLVPVTMSGVPNWEIEYDQSYILVSVDGSSSFILNDSSTFELILFDILTLQVGDDYSKAQDIFPQSASRENLSNPDFNYGFFVNYFYKRDDGKYYISDDGIFIGVDLSTNKINTIYNVNHQ